VIWLTLIRFCEWFQQCSHNCNSAPKDYPTCLPTILQSIFKFDPMLKPSTRHKAKGWALTQPHLRHYCTKLKMPAKYHLPILNIFVPQEGQTPWVAGLPFFMVICFASFISFLARHFIQYASIVNLLICTNSSVPTRSCQDKA